MSKRSQRLELLRRRFETKYDPKTAFADDELIAIGREMEQLTKQLETHDECGTCDGWGSIECGECGNEKECEDCDGGLIEK